MASKCSALMARSDSSSPSSQHILLTIQNSALLHIAKRTAVQSALSLSSNRKTQLSNHSYVMSRKLSRSCKLLLFPWTTQTNLVHMAYNLWTRFGGLSPIATYSPPLHPISSTSCTKVYSAITSRNGLARPFPDRMRLITGSRQ